MSVYQSLTDQYSTSTGRFGEGYGPTLFVDLACDGTESAVRDCNTGSSQSCSSNYGDAGIRCDHLDSSGMPHTKQISKQRQQNVEGGGGL